MYIHMHIYIYMHLFIFLYYSIESGPRISQAIHTLRAAHRYLRPSTCSAILLHCLQVLLVQLHADAGGEEGGRHDTWGSHREAAPNQTISG